MSLEKKRCLLTLDLLCVGGARIMRINLLSRRALVQADEPMQKVFTCGVVVLFSPWPSSTPIIGEEVLQW